MMPGHTKCCTCHAQSSSQNWRPDAPKCNGSQEISARTSEHLWWTCLLYRTCHGNASGQILFKCPTPAIVFGNATKPSRFAHFWQGAQSLAPATRNDQKWSGHVTFLTFWPRHVLSATTACTFSTSQFPKKLSEHVVFLIPVECATEGSTKVFSQKPGWKPIGPTYFCQNENLWVDMSHLGDVFTTLKRDNNNLMTWHGVKSNHVFFGKMDNICPKKIEKSNPWGFGYWNDQMPFESQNKIKRI